MIEGSDLSVGEGHKKARRRKRRAKGIRFVRENYKKEAPGLRGRGTTERESAQID